MNISIIIPLLNEQDSLKELANSIDQVLNAYSLSYEIILIDDGSNDGSWKIIGFSYCTLSLPVPEVLDTPAVQ